MNLMTNLMSAFPAYWESLKLLLSSGNKAEGEDETDEEPPMKRRRKEVGDEELLCLSTSSDHDMNTSGNRIHRLLGHDTSDDFLLALKDRSVTPQRSRRKSFLESSSSINLRRYSSSSSSTGKENALCVSDDEQKDRKEVQEEGKSSSDIQFLEDSCTSKPEDSVTQGHISRIDIQSSCRLIGRRYSNSDKENEVQVLKLIAPRFLERQSSPTMNTHNILNASTRPLSCSMEKMYGSFSLKRPNSGSLSSSSMGNLSLSASNKKLPLLDESVRLNERKMYSQLLQNFTNVSVSKYPSKYERFRRERQINMRGLPLVRKKILGNVEVIDLTSSEVLLDINNEKPTSLHSIDRKDSYAILDPAPSSQLRKKLEKCHVYDVTWMTELTNTYRRKDRENQKQILEEKLKAALATQRSEQMLNEILEERVRLHLRLSDVAVEEGPMPVAEDEVSLPELTPDMEKKVAYAFKSGPGNEIITEKFNLRITRRDIHTLVGTNWLNDEVINFYMNLLIERGKQDKYPSVYCFNTFFYPKLASQGHASLKRWTRRIDIFAHEMLIVPVHLGVHWCLASVNLKEKVVRYYDSMGGANNTCLQNLMRYLQDECMDKRRTRFDTTGWSLENVKDNPQQMNGSDCGMFSCMYAEFICRKAKINFSQSDMPYFRRKMAYEIITAQLIL